MKVNIGGVFVENLTLIEWVSYFYADFDAGFDIGKPKFFTSLNGNALSKSGHDANFRSILNSADGVDPDGMSIVFASRLFSDFKIPERVVTTDFAYGIFDSVEKRELKVYLLGGTERENSLAISILRNKYPNIQFDGRNGYFSEFEEDMIISQINSFSPHLLFVGLGVPKEQLFVNRNIKNLKSGWVKTCGGMFKVFCGEVDRPPLWVQKIGFEWFYRCIREPRHVLWRYITTNPHSVFLMIKHSRFFSR